MTGSASPCLYGANHQPRSLTNLIDRIRHDIQQRLDQLLAEADKLRHALAALDPRERSVRPPQSKRSTRSQPAASRPTKAQRASSQAPAPRRTRAAGAATGASASARTAPGETKTRVLAALSSSE